MQFTAIGACDEFSIASGWILTKKEEGESAMVKLRMMGPTNELKRMKRVIERNSQNKSIIE